MRNFTGSKEIVGKIAKSGVKIALSGVAAILYYASSKDAIDKLCFNDKVKYSDAVGSILESGMFSADKNTAIALLGKDKDADFYKAVIKIANSSMYSSDKLKAIQHICEE